MKAEVIDAAGRAKSAGGVAAKRRVTAELAAKRRNDVDGGATTLCAIFAKLLRHAWFAPTLVLR